jgi:predicted XRE-type DNA-binding protein
MTKANEEIRRFMGAKGLKQWQVAEAMGMRDENFSRKLRKELPEEEKAKIMQVITNIGDKKTILSTTDFETLTCIAKIIDKELKLYSDIRSSKTLQFPFVLSTGLERCIIGGPERP